MRRFIVALTISLMAIGTFAQNFDYGDALEASLIFFDANRCGPDAGKGNYFSWRGACHTGDAVPGGYHDAGDHVKFGLPGAWSCATMAWATYEFPEIFGGKVKARNERVLRYFADYFVKCLSGNSFVYQIGNGDQDHGYWGPPEDQGNGSRPVLKAPPGPEVCAQTSAALALMYLNYKDAKYLSAAKSLFNIAKGNLKGKYNGGAFYKSSSTYDDMVWAAIWLSEATGDDSYMEKADEWMDIKNDYGDDPYNKKWGPAWDDMTVFNLIKMAQITGNDKYFQGLKNNFEWFKTVPPKSPGGIPIFHNWAVLRYASAEAGAGYIAYKLLGDESLLKIGDKIINYCLGANPSNRSYITGWGKNPPKHPHHRANEPTRGGPTNNMYGALVGGPDINDKYVDDVNQYIYTEVALDYNASFILGLSAYMWYKNGGKPANRGPSVTITSPLNGVALPIGAEITINVEAKDKEGSVAKIELFKGDELLKSSTSSPLTFKYKSTSAGEFVLSATATDNENKTSKAPPVRVEFTAPCTPGQNMNTKGWKITASNTSQNAEDALENAIDGNIGTRWGSGAGMSKGMWFQVNMGYPRKVNEITIDAAGSGSDWPKKLKAYATNDPANLGDPVASEDGALKKTIKFSKTVTAQYIRIVCEEGQGGSWWSIHELSIPCLGDEPLKQNVLSSMPGKPAFSFNVVPQGTSMRINYTIPDRGRVTIEEYLLNGSRTKVLFDGIRNAGDYSFMCTTCKSESKTTLLKITHNGISQLKRVTLTH